MEKQLITVRGTRIFEGQVKKLHVATCDCACKIVRAQNESGLNQYIGNPKFKAKWCNTLLGCSFNRYFNFFGFKLHT